MNDLLAIALLLLLVTSIEATVRPLLPIGVVLAVGMLVFGIPVGPTALIGAFGVLLADLSLAMNARRGRGYAARSSAARAQADALRARMAASGAFARITFAMAALPGPTAKLVYPMLGTMRAPLGPAIAGTIVGRTLLYLLMASVFAGIARGATSSDADAATLLVVLAGCYIIIRVIGWIDWPHRSATGAWRLREPVALPFDMRFGRMSEGPADPSTSRVGDDADIIDAEVIGEESDPDDHDDSSGDAGAGELPSGS